MANRDELAAELAALKEEVARMRSAAEAAGAAEPDGATGQAAAEADDGLLAGTGLDKVLAQIEGSEIDKLLKRFGEELESLHRAKPLLTVSGAFVLGYLLGRAR